MAFGFVIIGYASLRLIVRRKTKPTVWNPDIIGLQMFPTMRTVLSMSSRRSHTSL
jgi:sodium/potassium-transporting ATPase subunit alpha